MFENFVLNKIENETAIIKKLAGDISKGEALTRMKILNSELPDFTKDYILFEFNEKSNEEELISKISKANKLLFNFTLRPGWTLQTFLFNNFESRPPNEIVQKLNLFPFYSFYTDSIKEFITENFQIFLTKAEVISIIDHTNTAILSKLTTDINNIKIKNFFLQIFLLKYQDESNYNLESQIPYSFIQIFLDDKSFTGLEKKFSVVKGLTGETGLSLKDIIKVLTDKYGVTEKVQTEEKNTYADAIIITEKTEPQPKIKTEDKKIELKEIPSTRLSKEKPEPKKEIPNHPGKIDIVIEEPQKPVVTKEIPVKDKSDKKIPKVNKKIYSEDLIKASEEKVSAGSDGKGESKSKKGNGVKDLFNGKQLEKITPKIYDSDLIYQERSFNKLSNFKKWSEASEHLKDVFKINGVDIYNKDVISFVNILNDYYKSKE